MNHATRQPVPPPTHQSWPLLAPAARRLWRDPQTLQLGRAAGRAMVLSGLDPTARAVLALLDGTRETAQVLATARTLGCHPGRAVELLGLLDDAGLLEDAGADRTGLAGLDPDERERLGPDLSSLALLGGEGGIASAQRRLAAGVRVIGAGRVGAPLAALLTGAGLGAVDVLDRGSTRLVDAAVGGLAPSDSGRRRDEAAVGRAAALSARASVGASRRPDLVVLAPVSPAALEEDLSAVPPGVPHLLAEVRDTVGVVGPFVLPGSTACLRCLDLARSDLDPGWPALAAQLASPVRGIPPCDGVLAVAVAAQACLQVLALLDGASTPWTQPAQGAPGTWPTWQGRPGTSPPAAVGGTLELALPDWRWRRRSWALHPDCGCAPAPVRRAG